MIARLRGADWLTPCSCTPRHRIHRGPFCSRGRIGISSSRGSGRGSRNSRMMPLPGHGSAPGRRPAASLGCIRLSTRLSLIELTAAEWRTCDDGLAPIWAPEAKEDESGTSWTPKEAVCLATDHCRYGAYTVPPSLDPPLWLAGGSDTGMTCRRAQHPEVGLLGFRVGADSHGLDL